MWADRIGLMDYPTEIVYFGVTYTRNPGSEQRAHRVYYAAPRGSGRETLHRDIYRVHHGPIPQGWHVHHLDENPLNNHPSNLVALPPQEHARVHPGSFDRRSPEWLEHLATIRQVAAEWHGSPEGHSWHVFQGAASWAERSRETLSASCTNCGGPVDTFFTSGRGEERFCSRRCINAHNEQSRRYYKPAACPICGGEFQQRRGRPETCGPKCGAALRTRRRQ